MDTPKGEKVNERPYWTKYRCWLLISLADIQVELCLSINHPKTSLPPLREDVGLKSEDETKDGQGDQAKLSHEEEEKYSENFGWQIRAIGHFEHGDCIGLLKKDGTVSEPENDFYYADVFLKPISDSEKKKAVGHLFYDDAEYSERKPYLCLELFVPETRLEKLCKEITSNRLSAMEVGVEADLFRRDVDVMFSEPQMSKRFLIEEDFLYNKAYLTRLSAFHSVKGKKSEGMRGSDVPSDIGKRLLSIEEYIKGAGKDLKTIIFILSVVYFGWKLLAWLFR